LSAALARNGSWAGDRVEMAELTKSTRKDVLPILELEGLEHHLGDAEKPAYVVFVRQRLTIMPGDFVALLGPSGCGKTTLLTIMGLLRRPTSPESLARFSIGVKQDGESLKLDLRDAWCHNRQRLIEQTRRRYIGFALQSGELLPALTVCENISVPLRVNGTSPGKTQQRVDELVDAFQLRPPRVSSAKAENRTRKRAKDEDNDLSHKRVNKLSGGEYQRVSLARAIAHRPRLVFVDEPTASLNREMARDALQQFRQLQADAPDPGATIMITHDETLAADFANVTIRMAPIRNQAAGEVVEIIRDDPADPPVKNESSQAGATPGQS
jgi:putative ABC transport system ATP-binding protein